jgi:transposase
VDANGNPVRIFVTAGTTADYKYGEDLITGINAIALLADRGYDVTTLIELAKSMGMEIVIPPKRNRKEQRNYDRDLYKLRHLVENAFLMLKQWRGIATRYAKNTDSFLAAIRIRSLLHWAKLQVG